MDLIHLTLWRLYGKNGGEKGCPYILRGFLRMDERFPTREQSTRAELEDQQALRDIEARRTESEEYDAQEYSSVLSKIQAENGNESATPVVSVNEAVTASQKVQPLQLISKEEQEGPEESITWFRASQRRTRRLKRAA